MYRYDSIGFSAKYCVYLCMEDATKAVISFHIISKDEVKVLLIYLNFHNYLCFAIFKKQ